MNKSMSTIMNTSLAGRVRNTTLPKARALLPLAEALANSIQSVDTYFNGEDLTEGRIDIYVQRNRDLEFGYRAVAGKQARPPIEGFRVVDNGIGFNEENMKSFMTLDSDHKADLGCRGVGRLMWLKAFEKISIESLYEDADGQLQSRGFDFTIGEGVQLKDSADVRTLTRQTSVALKGFDEAYAAKAPKEVEFIARELFEDCIWYLVREGGAPQISIHDEDRVIKMDDMLEGLQADSMTRAEIKVKDSNFSLVGLLIKSSQKRHELSLCAGNRVVEVLPIKEKIAGLHGPLRHKGQKLVYIGFLSSQFLDDAATADRLRFEIPQSSDGVLDHTEIAMDDIVGEVLPVIEKRLKHILDDSRKEGERRINGFVNNHAPHYRPVVERLIKRGLSVDPSIDDAGIEMALHKGLQDVETEILQEGREVLEQVSNADDIEIDTKLQELLDKIDEAKRSDLASYVGRRRVVLDIMRGLLSRRADGKYQHEERLHSLIMPMRAESSAVPSDASNLWIIDERLAFHDYLSSDIPIKNMQVTGADDLDRPDIAALQLTDNPILVSPGQPPLASITVIEFKRPMRDDLKNEKDPIRQSLDYLKKIREGKVTTSDGRPVRPGSEVPGFCYIIADMTDSMVENCKMADLQETADRMGYFGFNRNHQAYIEVMSFDRLLQSALERNHAFFDKLGLPIVVGP